MRESHRDFEIIGDVPSPGLRSPICYSK
jgi:hypothetical protein